MARIAIIVHGGVALRPSKEIVPAVEGLIRRLAERFDITVYTCVSSGGSKASYSCGRAQVIHLPCRHGNSPGSIILRAVQAVWRDHRARAFDLVHGLWGIPGGVAAVLSARLTGLPSLVSLLGGEAASLPAIGYGNMRKPLSRTATLWASHHATAVAFLTNYQLDQFRKHGFRRTTGIHVLPLGTDPVVFHPPAAKTPPPPFRLLHVGHLNKVKDQSTLLRSFGKISRHHDCLLRVVGEGSLMEDLQKEARGLGISNRVSFAGYVPHDRLPDHLAWAHLLVHSSQYEGQGVVFTEAACSGVPICGTNVGLLADLGGDFAVRVPPGDDDRLASALVDLLNDQARMERLSRFARAWAVEHSIDWTASAYSSAYESLLRID